jgi:hypothetical protein
MAITSLRHGDSNPLKKFCLKFQRRKTDMATSPVDKSKDFRDSGMTLITELSSEFWLRKSKKQKYYQSPKNRLDKHCGGKDGFDDYVERFEEGT